jgi:hypothetical protein
MSKEKLVKIGKLVPRVKLEKENNPVSEFIKFDTFAVCHQKIIPGGKMDRAARAITKIIS